MATFDGQSVLITGASSGIGGALARELSARGADVALLARRVDRLEALATELRGRGRRALVVAGDVTSDGDLERAVAQTLGAFGRLDVLVANAGYSTIGRFDTLTLDDYRRQFETNVFGVLRTVRAGLAELRRARGRLVIIGSVNGHVAPPGSSAYAMSKFALRALAQALDFELRPSGVSVTLVSPGLVDTEIHQIDKYGVRHAEARHPAPAAIRMSAERAAAQIVTAVARRRREVVITAFGRLVVWLTRHLPGLMTWTIRTFGIRGRRDPAEATNNPT